MTSLDIKIKGQCRSKKNSKRIFCRGKFPTVLPSKAHEDWHQTTSESFKMPPGKVFPLQTTHSVTLTFFSKTKRSWDLSNMAESIMDFLVDVGVLKDDNYNVVPNLQLIYGGLARSNPRVEIEILY